MGSNENDGRLVYKASAEDGVSTGRIGMLEPTLALYQVRDHYTI